MDAIFLDLDGTLIDSRAGITGSIRRALDDLGATPPEGDDLRWCIGPPMRSVFETLLGPRADIDAAVDAYRAHYSAGAMFDADLYDGVGEMLEDLRATGAGIWIATSKTADTATEIAAEFGLSAWIDGLFGAAPDGTMGEKPGLLARALEETGVAPARAVMVGDRRFDIEGARANGMASIGALWGFADEGELHLAEADALAGHPAEVPQIALELVGPAEG